MHVYRHLLVLLILAAAASAHVAVFRTPAVPTSADADPWLEVVTQTQGPVRAVHINGSLAYVGEGPRIVVYDASDSHHLVEVGRSIMLQAVVVDLEVVQDYAFATLEGKGVAVVSVADRRSPELVAVYATECNSCKVDVLDDRVYVATGFRALLILSVTDKRHPTLLGTFAQSATDVQVVGGRAFVADGFGLRIVSVADAAAPKQVGHIPDLGYTSAIELTGDYAVLTAAVGGLKVVSVADVTTPRLVATVAARSVATGIRVVGDRAYVTNDVAREDHGWIGIPKLGTDGMQVVSLADPVHPVDVGFVQVSDITSVDAEGGLAFVAARSRGLRVVSVADPRAPAEIAATAAGGFPIGVDVAGGNAYLANGYPGLGIMSFADPARPELAATVTGFVSDVKVDAGYAYLVRANGGEFRVVNVSDALRPVEVGHASLRGWTRALTVSGNYVYLVADNVAVATSPADIKYIVHVVALADPTNPVVVSSTEFAVTQDLPHSIAAAGDYAYVDKGSELLVISVADKARPVEVGSVDTGTLIYNSKVVGDSVYVSGSDLRVVDVTDKRSPRVTSVVRECGGDAIDVIGDRVYTADTRLCMVSSGEHTPMQLIDALTLPSSAAALRVQDDFVYVADAEGGLVVARIVRDRPRPTATPSSTATPSPSRTATPSPSATWTPSVTPTPLPPVVFRGTTNLGGEATLRVTGAIGHVLSFRFSWRVVCPGVTTSGVSLLEPGWGQNSIEDRRFSADFPDASFAGEFDPTYSTVHGTWTKVAGGCSNSGTWDAAFVGPTRSPTPTPTGTASPTPPPTSTLTPPPTLTRTPSPTSSSVPTALPTPVIYLPLTSRSWSSVGGANRPGEMQQDVARPSNAGQAHPT